MPQSWVQIYLHVVFSTKHRQPFLEDNQIREQTHAYLAGICKNLKCPALIVGGVGDHVHVLNRHSKNICVADFLRDLKRPSSEWIRRLAQLCLRSSGKTVTAPFPLVLRM